MSNRNAFLLTCGALLLGTVASTNAAPKTCCDTSTGKFLALPNDTCIERGHTPFDPGNPASAAATRVCFMQTNQLAQDALGELGLPNAATLGGEIPKNLDELSQMLGGTTQDSSYACCDTSNGVFVDDQPAAACRALGPEHYPDMPQFLSQVQACRRKQLATADGAWAVEDYAENIDNGGMEIWRDEFRPVGFTTFGVDPKLTQGQGLDIQVVFRDSDAHTGRYSVLLKNQDLTPNVPSNLRGIVASALGSKSVVAAAGLLTCEEPCVIEQPDQGVANTMSGAYSSIASLPARDVTSHVCGAYKGYIARSDQLNINLTFASGQQVEGGAVANFTDSSSEWIEFIIPMSSAVGELSLAGRVGISARIERRSGTNTAGPVTGAPTDIMHWRMSPLTAVNVDSVHFCDPMGMTAFHPPVLVDGRTDAAVPEGEETRLGVQTFVNTDNDDADTMFDATDDEVTGDDELVRLLLYLPLNSFGSVRFDAPQLAQKRYALWADADKREAFTQANQDLEVLELLRTTDDGRRYEREIWVEALAPSERAGDIKFEFSFANKMAGEAVTRDAVALSSVAIEKISFRGQDNSVDDQGELDADPNWPFEAPDAVRVFPGKRWDAKGNKPEDKPRNRVDVLVDLNVAPTRPLPLYFRSFDVDDPTASHDLVDSEEEADDNRGTTPTQSGLFPKAANGLQKITFDQRSADFEFQTTMQPGDNFRIVGGGDPDHLKALENDDTGLVSLTADEVRHGEKIVDPDVWLANEDVVEAEVRMADKAVSPVLTVWRKIHFEIDKMAAVEHNELQGFVVSARSVTPDKENWVQYELTIDQNIFQSLPDDSKTDNAGIEHAYKRGVMTINRERLAVVYSTARNSGNDDVTIAFTTTDTRGKTLEEIVGADVAGLPFTLTDNDKYKNGDALGDIPLQQMAPVYARAYMLPVLEPLAYNPVKEVPFLLNYLEDNQPYLRSKYAFDNKKYHEDQDFWLVYLLTAFQGMTTEDGDGGYFKYLGLGGFVAEPGISGQADSLPGGIGGQGATIFLESGRELELGNQGRPGWRLADTAPHEVGHLFGGDHADGGLMDDKPANKSNHFSPKSLARMRGKLFP